MKPISSIYIHFLDRYHGLRAHDGNYHSLTIIQQEADLAFRLALMFSERVILPCSSLSESKLCRLTIKAYPEFNDHGIIGLSSPDGSIQEHLERKRSTYNAESPSDLAKAYERMQAGEMPAFYKKKGSTTRQIGRVWSATAETARLEEFLREGASASAIPQIERLWPSIPDLLEGRAFVPDHVNRIFEQHQVPVRPSAAAEIIEPAYIGGYAAQFGSVVSDMRALNSPFEYGVADQPKLSFRALVQRLHRSGLQVGFANASSAVLWVVYGSREWDELATILFHGTHSREGVELATSVAAIMATASAAAAKGSPLLIGNTWSDPPRAANEPFDKVESSEPFERGLQTMVERNPGALFAAVICAVEQEFDALRRAVPPAGSITGSEYVTTLPNGRMVLVTRLQSMGNTQAAVTATKLIETRKPENIVLAGIAGGFPSDDSKLGDILVADQVVAYELAKLKGEAVDLRPQVYRASFALVEAAEAVARRGKWKSRITLRPPEPRPEGPTHHVGTTLSGEKVVAKSGFLHEFRAAWTKITGIEMEAAGAMTAVHLSASQPRFIMIKGICDHADEAKADGWQPYAADAAAAFVAEMLVSPEMSSRSGGRVLETVATPALSDRFNFLQATYESWKNLATYFEISSSEQAAFDKGHEPQAIWNWLKSRGRLKELPVALMVVGRRDILKRWPQLVEQLTDDDG